MPRIECVFFDCDGTLVDSEVLCCQAYVNIFIPYGVNLSLEEVIKTYKGVKLYEIIARISQQHGLTVSVDDAERHFRQEVKRLFDEFLQPIEGARELVQSITVPMAVVSNGPSLQRLRSEKVEARSGGVVSRSRAVTSSY
jgi:beta-phosphoglucomutase-like phosphatase (HAD superfamily)